jgi:hypothetical protein
MTNYKSKKVKSKTKQKKFYFVIINIDKDLLNIYYDKVKFLNLKILLCHHEYNYIISFKVLFKESINIS